MRCRHQRPRPRALPSRYGAGRRCLYAAYCTGAGCEPATRTTILRVAATPTVADDVTLWAKPARVFAPSPLQAAARACAACSQPPRGASVCSPARACRSLSPRSRLERAPCLSASSQHARSLTPPWTAATPRPRCTRLQLQQAKKAPRRLLRRSLALARRPPRRRSRLGLRASQKKRRRKKRRKRKRRRTPKKRCSSARKRRASRRQPGASLACDQRCAACGRSGRVARRARSSLP